MKLGLRVDVDTLRGTRDGVPALLALLREQKIRASFFFSVGPDNMGRHLWRLLRPSFAAKMLRTRAPSLYGWDILLRGTCWPGPRIGERQGQVIRAAAEDGHELGLHAWDHYTWQAHMERMDADTVYSTMKRGVEELTRLAGRVPTCAAAPAWRCTDLVLEQEARFGFRYCSDCRGDRVFRPLVNGRVLDLPQVPSTLPTYDELIGREGVSPANYNEHLLGLLRPEGLNVLVTHAEVEGIMARNLFAAFLRLARERGITVVPLGDCLPAAAPAAGRLERRAVAGREGWAAYQEEVAESAGKGPG